MKDGDCHTEFRRLGLQMEREHDGDGYNGHVDAEF
jgi:hypothetical protein